MAFTHRPILMSDAGIVVSGHHKASEAGAAMLRRGGNAMDAAIAAAAALAVAIPHMNGLGGDAIGLFYDAREDKVTAINGSGRAPGKATIERYRRLGCDEIPQRGPLSISVPGVVRAWEDCLRRWGTKSLSEALDAAITLAEDGVPTDQNQLDFFMGPVYEELAATFTGLVDLFGASKQPRTLGAPFRQPLLARTLRRLAQDGAAGFYQGSIAKALLTDLRSVGALLSAEDLAKHATRFDESLRVCYRSRTVHAAPPNSQGLALILLLGLDEAAASTGAGSPAMESDLDVSWYMRAKRAAFAIRDRYAADPGRTRLPADLLTRESFLRMNAESAAPESEARAAGGDTSTLVVVDSAGNAVSWVQSLFEEFGSGVTSAETGVVFHNRLYLEQLSDHPIRGLQPRMRPFHTLCPALVVSRGRCDMTIATPGDHGQPQSIYQVLRNVYAEDLSIQDAIERPRLRHDQGNVVMIEDRAPVAWREALETNGYETRDMGSWSRLMGGVNAVQRLCDDVWGAGADPRRSCYAVTAD